MKTIISVSVAVVATALITFFVGCGKSNSTTATPTGASAGTPNDAAVASAHILGAIAPGVSASVKAETRVGDAATIHEMNMGGGNFTLTNSAGTSFSRTAPTSAANPAQKLDVNVKVVDGSLFVRDGKLNVGNGTLGVGNGALNVGNGTLGVGNGNLAVGSGTLNVGNAVASGSIAIDGKEFVLYKDQCGGIYYRGTDGNLYPIK